MQTRFYIDPATGLPHIHDHQVDEDEVMEVLEKPGEDRAGRDGSRIALGQTVAGRYLQEFLQEFQLKHCDQPTPFTVNRSLVRDVHEHIAFSEFCDKTWTAHARNEGAVQLKVGFPATRTST